MLGSEADMFGKISINDIENLLVKTIHSRRNDQLKNEENFSNKFIVKNGK